MADIKKIATREGYGEALVELGREHDNIVVFDADLAGSTKSGVFGKAFPGRHFNAGIAEADMICAAAGAASMGMVAFASSFAMFATGRAFEQIRNSVGYTRLNVKICASHGGISVGEDGASHQCCEDLALMRAIPNMIVMNPSDNVEAKAAVKAAYEGKTGLMITYVRKPGTIYAVEFGSVPVKDTANKTKYVPQHQIHPDGNDVTDDLLREIAPLIVGEIDAPRRAGLPYHFKIK